jgi:hypothetical protein
MWQLVNEEKQSLKDWVWGQIIAILLTEKGRESFITNQYFKQIIRNTMITGIFYEETMV